MGELQVTRFSTTTKLSGQATFVVGANAFTGWVVDTGATTFNDDLQLTLNRAPPAYSKNLSAGAGLWWQSNGFSLRANSIAANGDSGNPSVSEEDGGGGIGNRNSGATGSVQLGDQQEQGGLAATWTYVQPETQFLPGATPFTHSAIDHNINTAPSAR